MRGQSVWGKEEHDVEPCNLLTVGGELERRADKKLYGEWVELELQ